MSSSTHAPEQHTAAAEDGCDDSANGDGYELTFLEAGPRELIMRRPNVLNVGILVSGGIAPGINAVIAAIIERHHAYSDALSVDDGGSSVRFWAFSEGFRALCDVGKDRIRTLSQDDQEQISRWIDRGGSWLPTARVNDLANGTLAERDVLFGRINLRIDEVDVLYVIGGDGSMRAAHAIWTVYRQLDNPKPISIIGIPKTMDNDILWVWQSFGFLSAVEESRRAVMQLATEVRSNPRIGVVQLFGSVSGFVAGHAALGTNLVDLVLIPEMTFTMLDVCAYMEDRLRNRWLLLQEQRHEHHYPYGLVVMGETAIPSDFDLYMNEEYVGLSIEEKKALQAHHARRREILGETPNALRNAGLKIVSRVLQRYVNEFMGKGDEAALGEKTNLADRNKTRPELYWQSLRVVTNEPRHLIRSVEPTTLDIITATRLGMMAVDGAMAGYTDCMVSQWLTEYVVVPLKLVTLGRKRVPLNGIFWRTVVSRTGQADYRSGQMRLG